jgi:hypothetical protein
MKGFAKLITTLFLFITLVTSANAEVKRVQMKIAGYLCGN